MTDKHIPTMPQSEHIPTMPQSEHIPTMPQSEHIPTMPQSEHIPTMPQNGHIPTMPQESNSSFSEKNNRTKTVPQEQQKDKQGTSVSRGKSVISTVVTFVGERGGEFTIDANKKVSVDSGESQIYYCSMNGNANEYVARILISIRPSSPANKIATRNKVINFLAMNSRNSKTHILPLIDYATVKLDDGEYFVEVYPFCKGGDLSSKRGKIPYAELTKKIIPAINSAIDTFHKAGFVHRDVKPDNLYYYNDEIVLGDFGITCDLRDDGFATDRDKTGTLGYYAPELMSQAALIASDYYSFGQTIWTLYSGEMMYQSIFRVYKSKGIEELRNKINKAMLDNEYFGLDEIKPEEAFFEILIRGLLQYDPSSRFGYEEVKRWIAGDKSVAHNISKYNSQSIYRTPFKYDGKEYWDNDEVFQVLASNWEYAKQGLYSGTLKNFYGTVDFALSSKIDEITKQYSRESKERSAELQNDIGLCLFLLQLNEYKKLAWKGIVFNELFDLSRLVAGSIINGDIKIKFIYIELLSTEIIKLWYEKSQSKAQKEIDKNFLNAINEINGNANVALAQINLLAEVKNEQSTTTDKFDSGWSNEYAISLSYFLFADNDEFIKFDKCSNVDQIAQKTVEQKSSASLYLDCLVSSPIFCAFLYRCGYVENVHMLVKATTDRHLAVDTLFDFLMSKCEDEKIKVDLLECYRLYGPDSQMLWLQRHLDLYNFNGQKAIEVEETIKSKQINGNNIDSVRKCYKELKLEVEKMRSMFVDNVYLAICGLKGNKDKDGVTSKHLQAYWHADFLGNAAPVGFIYAIQKKGDGKYE